MRKIAFFINSFYEKFKTNFLKVIFTVIGCALILLFSGSSYITFGASSKIKIILYVIAFVYFLVLSLAIIKPSFFKIVKEEKKVPIPSFVTICFGSMILFAALSFLFNKNKADNINTYISFILTMLITYFVFLTVKPKTILKLFKNTMWLVCIIDIVIFAYTYISKTFFPTFYYSSEYNVIGSHMFLSSDLITSLSLNYFGKYRLYGILWEPSTFGVVLVVALICDVFSKDKYTILRSAIITLAVVLTFSLSAYFLYLFYIAILICKNLKGLRPYYFVMIFMALVVVAVIFMDPITKFLADKIPSIFSKLSNENYKSTSMSTRWLSLRYYLEVFIKNPIFGFGGVTANEMYHSIRSAAVTADTSTFGSLLASFGLAGVIYVGSMFFGIFANRRMEAPLKILLAFAIFISTSSQGQASIIGLNIIYFLPLFFVRLPHKAREYNAKFYSNLGNSTVKDMIFQKNDDGVVSSNIVLSFVLKGISILLAFVTIPVYLRYFNLDESAYGIWLAITSILTVITVFDFGMGNGLKNKLIKNIHDGNTEDSRAIISTTYLLTMIIGLCVTVVSIVTIFSINNSAISTVFFKGKQATNSDIYMFKIGFSIIMLAIGMQFFLKNINYILQAHQKNAITGIFMLITNASLLLFALIFANQINSSSKILALAIAYFVFLILPLLIANISLFTTSFRKFAPSRRFVDFSKSKDTVKVSLRFFIVQIGTLFLWSLNEWIILFLFDFNAGYITEYSEYYKLFSLLPIILGTIIQQPIWTALSKADVERNKAGIKKYMIVLLFSTVGIVALNLVLSLVLQFVFDIWLGVSAPLVETSKVLGFISYSVIYTISLALIIVCNAFSLFKAQIVSACLGIFVKIPLLIVGVKILGFSWEIVIFINTLCYLPVLIGAPLEIVYYLRKRKLVTDSRKEILAE